MNKLEIFLSGLFLGKLPPLSANAKETLVKFLPWIFIIFGIIGFFAILSAIFTLNYAGMLAIGMGRIWGFSIPFISFAMIYIITPSTQLVSIAGGYLMLKRKLLGWQLVFFCTLFSLIIHALYLSILGLALDLIFIYILFQVRNYFSI